VYSVTDPAQIVRAQPVKSTVLIDGDGFAVPTLAGLGILNGSQPFRYMGDMSPAALEQAAADGATIVITDTNRRRTWGENRLGDAFGPTLSAQEPIDQTNAPSLTLFQSRLDTQTVVSLQGAQQIVGTPVQFGPDPYGQPEQAFDGDPTTAWITGGFGETGMTTTIDFGEHDKKLISQVTIGRAPTSPSRVTHVRLYVGKRVINSALGAGLTTIAVPPTTVTSLTVEITGVTPGENPVGISTIKFPGLAVSLVTDMPTTFSELFNRVDAATQNELSTLPLDVVMTRVATGPLVLGFDEERSLNRQFQLPQERVFTVTGQAHSVGDLSALDRQKVFTTTPNSGVASCFSIGHLGSASLMVQLRGGLTKQVRDGGPVPLMGCAGTPLTLLAGTYHLTTAFGILVDQIVLASAGEAAPAPAVTPPSVRVLSASATQIRIKLGPSSGPYYLVSGQAYDAGWRATLDGGNLGAPIPLDGYTSGWRIDQLGAHVAVLSYANQPLTTFSFALSGAIGVGISILLAAPLWRRRGRHLARRRRR
jgi:hypothetical protein